MAKIPPPPPPQPHCFSIGGFYPTGEIRLRTILFGFAVVEELYEYSDGRKVWQKVQMGGTIPIKAKSA